ncbi:hypothetical protein C3L33_16358, partial [Rhododendron williamsianum]
MASSKSVYLRVMNADCKEESYSLAINVPAEDDVFEIRRDRRGSIPVLTPIKAANIPLHGGFAAVEITLYCIGGEPVEQQEGFGHHRSLPSLFSLDTSSSHHTWKRLTSMRIARSRPQTVAVDGKVCVISGADYGCDPETQWGEVFDTKSGKWGSLSPPSPLPEGCGLFAVAPPDLQKFVLGSYAVVIKISVLDIRLANADRHAGNILVQKYAEEGWIVLILIDHGCCLPENVFALASNLVAFDDNCKKFHGWDLSLECTCTLGISTMLLKKGASEATFLESVSLIMDHHLDELAPVCLSL